MQPVQSKEVNWVLRTTFFANRSKITELTVPTYQTGGFALSLGTFQIEQDSSPTQIFGLVGMDATGNPVAGKVGDANPDFQMSFSSDVDFHRFTLGMLFDYKQGGDIINLTEFLYDAGPNSKDYLPTGGGAGPIARSAQGFTEPYVQSGTYVKLRELNLSYNLPERIVSSIFGRSVRTARLSLTGRNLLRFTPYRGLDPGGEQLRQPGDRPEHRRGTVPAQSQLLLLRSTWGSDHDDHHEAVTRWLSSSASSARGPATYDIANPEQPGHHRGESQPSQVAATANGILIATPSGHGATGRSTAASSAVRRTGSTGPTRGSSSELMQGPLDPGSGAFGGDHWAEEYAAIRTANDLLAVIGTATALTAEEQSADDGLRPHPAGVQLSHHPRLPHCRTRFRSTSARTSRRRRRRS